MTPHFRSRPLRLWLRGVDFAGRDPGRRFTAGRPRTPVQTLIGVLLLVGVAEVLTLVDDTDQVRQRNS